MTSKQPQIPTPTAETSPSVESNPGSDETNSNDSGSTAPKITDPSKAHNTKKVSEVKGDIEVEALTKGFYNQDRKAVGDTFKISSLDEYGTWMKCIDPKIEKQAQKHLEAKYAKK